MQLYSVSTMQGFKIKGLEAFANLALSRLFFASLVLKYLKKYLSYKFQTNPKTCEMLFSINTWCSLE